jgi:hypothetical protein
VNVKSRILSIWSSQASKGVSMMRMKWGPLWKLLNFWGEINAPHDNCHRFFLAIFVCNSVDLCVHDNQSRQDNNIQVERHKDA